MDTEKRIDCLAIGGILGVIGTVLLAIKVQIIDEKINDMIESQIKLNALQNKINEINDRELKAIDKQVNDLEEAIKTK